MQRHRSRSRADVADFVVSQLTDNAWLGQTPALALVRHHDRGGPSHDRDITRGQLERGAFVAFDPG